MHRLSRSTSRRVLPAVVVLGVIMLAGVWAGPAAPQPADPKPITLRMSSPFPGPPGLSTGAIVRFQELVKQRTAGRIQFRNFWAGVLAGPPEALEAVGDGRADVVHYPTPYAADRTPLGLLEIGVPFSPSDPLVAYQIRRQMHREFPEFEREIQRHGGKLLTAWPTLSYDIQSATPTRTIDDMRGKRLGVVGLYMPDWVKAVGAAPVYMPIHDRYEAFQRGVLDGSIVIMEQFFEFRQYEVIKHYTVANLGSFVAHYLTVNLKTWNGLPADVQTIMLEAAIEAGAWHAEALRAEFEKGRRHMERQGVTFHTLPNEERVKWAGLMADPAGKFAADLERRGLPGKRILQRYIEVAEAHGWKWPRRWGQ